MGTRCQIEFKVNNETRRVYRHSDGYPEGVLPDLKEFLKWNEGRNTDIEYLTANFIYWSKRKYEELYLEKGKKWSDLDLGSNAYIKLGFGVCDNSEKHIHSDIEYFYKVIVKVVEDKKNIFEGKTTIKIAVYEVNENNELNLINTEKVKVEE